MLFGAGFAGTASLFASPSSSLTFFLESRIEVKKNYELRMDLEYLTCHCQDHNRNCFGHWNSACLLEYFQKVWYH